MEYNLPVYEILLKNIKGKKNLLVGEKKELVQKIEEQDEKKQELLYALIICYFKKNNMDIDAFNPSIAESVEKNNVTFDIDKFPIPLKKMLREFLSMDE